MEPPEKREIIPVSLNLPKYLEHISHALLVSSLSGRILLVNRETCNLWGYEKEEILHAGEHTLFGGDYVRPSEREGELLLTGVRKNGSSFTVELDTSPFYDESSNQQVYITLCKDVSRRVEEEKKLTERKDKYQFLIEHQTELIVQFDTDLRLIYACPRYLETFDKTEDQLLHHSFMSFVHEGDRENVRASLEQVKLPPHYTQHEERAMTRSGWRWFSWVARAVFDENEEITSIVSVGRDVTDRKQMQEKYHRLFEEAFDGIAVADTQTGIIVDCNAALARLVERKKSEIIGKKQSILHPGGEDTGEPTAEFKKHRDELNKEEIETQVITKTGKIKDVVIMANQIELDGTCYLQGIFHDVTDYNNALREIESLSKFPSENPTRVGRVDEQGELLYANEASDSLMETWEMGRGEPLPKRERDEALEVLEKKETKVIEITHGAQTLLTLLVPILEFNYVNFYARDISEIKRSEVELQRLATVDGLTNVYNRRFFLELSEKEAARARRYKKSLYLLMYDIDHFKRINDTYGHGAGDVVLKTLSEHISSILREADIFGRLGGEEFGVLLPETEEEEAKSVAERIRKTSEELSISTDAGDITVTLSLGGAFFEESMDSVEKLLQHADEALYKAKEIGRNRVVFGN